MTVAAMPKAISPGKLAQVVGRGEWKPTPHLNLLNRELMTLAAHAERRRSYNLACFGPPRHGKSRLLNEVFALWYLCTFPARRVIVASHSASLAADTFGANVLDMMDEFGGPIFGRQVRADRRSRDDWALTDGGGMRCVGVGGSLVGLGADLFIFDDIIASGPDALSEIIRNKTIDWYLSTARTRINAGGQQIFTMQRWHDDDPARRIVYDNLKKWSYPNGKVITLPAIADHDPARGETDPLGRSVGEALWPAMWPISKLEEIREDNEFWFAAQYQQRPVPRGGGMFQIRWFEDNLVHYRPDTALRVRAWDLAASDGKGDYTVGVLMSRKNEIYYVEDVIRGQWASHERDRIIRAACVEDNRRYPSAVVTWGEQEPGRSGKDSAEDFARKLQPFAAHTEPSSGSKVVRADGFAGACGRGDVRMCKGDWNPAFLQELCTFPMSKKDDQVDAASLAFNKLALGVRQHMPFLGPSREEYDPIRELAGVEREGGWRP